MVAASSGPSASRSGTPSLVTTYAARARRRPSTISRSAAASSGVGGGRSCVTTRARYHPLRGSWTLRGCSRSLRDAEDGELVGPVVGVAGGPDLEVVEGAVAFEDGAPAVVAAGTEEALGLEAVVLADLFAVGAAPNADGEGRAGFEDAGDLGEGGVDAVVGDVEEGAHGP